MRRPRRISVRKGEAAVILSALWIELRMTTPANTPDRDPTPPREAHPADDHRGEHLEEEPRRYAGRSPVRAGGDEPSRGRRDDAAQHEDAEQHTVHADPEIVGRGLVPPNDVHMPAEAGAPEEEAEEHVEENHQENHEGKPEHLERVHEAECAGEPVHPHPPGDEHGQALHRDVGERVTRNESTLSFRTKKALKAPISAPTRRITPKAIHVLRRRPEA